MNVQVKEGIHIQAPPEQVWDFTQDWSRRTLWDPAVLAAELLAGEPRTVRMRTAGGDFEVRYKQFDRPHRTSLAMVSSSGWLIARGGGSWAYEAEAGGTRFTQQNTLVISNRAAALLVGWAVRRRLRRLTRAALANAKRMIEAEPSAHADPQR